MRKICAGIILAIAMLLLVGCDGEGKQIEDTKVTLNAEREVIAVGETLTLIANTADADGKLKWNSDKPSVCTVNQDGAVKALRAGKAKITVIAENNKEASCEVIVADRIVSAAYDVTTNGYGKTRFSKIQDAASYGGEICVFTGEYDEWVTAEKNTRIFSEGNVKLRGAKGGALTLENLSFVLSEPPMANEAVVSATQSLKMEGCSVSVNVDTNDSKKLTGGYGVLIGNSVSDISVNDCSFAGLRYAVYLYRTGANIDVCANSFSVCGTAIGVNIRGAGGMLSDYDAKGVISGNIFAGCDTPTEFLYTGGGYTGKLDFKDFEQKDDTKEDENAG